jgi:copper resistance protein B
MRRLVLAAALALPAPALAQDPHAGHHGHDAPAEAPPDPHAGHRAAPPPADPHAGHVMAPAPDASPPPAPADHAADTVFPPERMAAARAQLAREHGDHPWGKAMLETAELRPAKGADGYAWEARASYGGDIDRFELKSEGEGARRLRRAEVQALYSRAVSPYFNLQAGVRQDFEPRPRRAYAVLGIDGVAPYWFELGGAVFLSDRGEASARLEAAYDLRLTQRLVLEPRGELNVAAQDIPELGLGSGVTTGEIGLRLRYAIRPEFAPYVGVHHERRFGRTARLARAAGEDARETTLVVGLRAWF